MATIGFTGHRDIVFDETILRQLAEQSKRNGDTWVHGGARGFDSQVDKVAREYGINQVVIPPDYKQYGWKQAPLARNREIVNRSDWIVAGYDGRTHGGTYWTIRYAEGKDVNKSVIRLAPNTVYTLSMTDEEGM